MPLATYISSHLKENADTAIGLVEAGFYSLTEIEGLAKHETREDVLEALAKKAIEIQTFLKTPTTLEVVEGEMLPPELQKPHACRFSPSTVIQFHDAAQQFGKLAVLCAAKAGAELNAIKADCKHGEWKNILKAMPFSSDTATRYRKLADQISERLLEQGGSFDLLSLPEPEHLADPENAEILQRVQQVSGGQGLRQLYFDWGIMREPKKGGDHGGGAAKAARSDEECEAAAQLANRTNWSERATTLNTAGLEEMSWAELDRSEIEGLQALFTQLATQLQSHLTKTR